MPEVLGAAVSDQETLKLKETTRRVDIPSHYIAQYNYFITCNYCTTEHPSKWRPKYLPVRSVFKDHGYFVYASLGWRLYWIFERLSILFQIGFVIYRWGLWGDHERTVNPYSILAFAVDLLLCFNLQTWMLFIVIYNHLHKHRMVWAFVPARSYETVSALDTNNGFFEMEWERFVKLAVLTQDEEKQSLLGASAKGNVKVKMMVYKPQWWSQYYGSAIRRLVMLWLWYIAVFIVGIVLYYRKTGNIVQ
mmetsp:Transcript_4569/g.6378  ORF Transcript_4569/g.6378 Transcript_4569/m.6378 type:complete len:248 (+) Transcript_4569:59-802(+)